MHAHLFPLSSSASWISADKPAQCSEKVSSWLYDKSSLTQKLEGLYERFTVQVKQQITVSSASSSLSNYFSNEDKVFVREVFLCCDNIPVVFAQTEIPLSTLSKEQAQLATIGSQSLGRILFQTPNMTRGKIEVAELTEKSQLVNLCQPLHQSCNHPLWARRSLFYLNDKPLLVSELFLPALGIY